MSDAILPLVGVLLGGLINWWATRGVEERGQRRELRAGVRLLTDEAVQVEARVEAALAQNRWWTAIDKTLPSDKWVAYEPVLARGLLLEEWLHIRNGFGAVQALNQQAAYALAAQGDIGVYDYWLHPPEREQAETALRLVGDARNRLDRLTIELQAPRERLRALVRGKRVTLGK